MSRIEEAQRLRARAADLRSEALHMQHQDESGARALFSLAKGFDRDAARYEHRENGFDLTPSNIYHGWKTRRPA